MKNKKMLASVSLDLDNQWSYLKIHGDSGWKSFPSYFDIFIPYVLKALDEFNLKITFFIVGKDASLQKNFDTLKLIPESGHDIANHSFNHESWLHLYSKKQLREEILTAEDHIRNLTGFKTIGFRGPGFSWNQKLINILPENGYLYDASILPTFIGPLARLYYFKTSNLSKEEKKERKELFGKFTDGFKRLKPYYWENNSNVKLLEIPVSTIPFFKTPFHLSYLIYLNYISPALMKLYLKTAINLCRLTKTEPSFLLHPLDLIGGDQVKELSFFPGMNVESKHKIKLFNYVINELMKNFNLVNMKQHAKKIECKSETKFELIKQT